MGYYSSLYMLHPILLMKRTRVGRMIVIIPGGKKCKVVVQSISVGRSGLGRILVGENLLNQKVLQNLVISKRWATYFTTASSAPKHLEI